MIPRKEKINKPFVNICYHYYNVEKYVGAVWQSDKDGEWSAFSMLGEAAYGFIGDFDTEQQAEECLFRRLNGDKNAVGRNSF